MIKLNPILVSFSPWKKINTDLFNGGTDQLISLSPKQSTDTTMHIQFNRTENLENMVRFHGDHKIDVDFKNEQSY